MVIGGSRLRLRHGFAQDGLLARVFLDFHFFHFFDGDFGVGTGEDGGDRA